eukprot:GFUD01010117.1.p1 GENE.GFUD01010117.1~~GFUD01010117.1.p1  ORF type:complete len:531 (+),score=150.68 GFUD01010117.1:47-1639(+)
MTANTEEHQLRRLLHTGTGSNTITLRGGAADLDKKELEPVNSLASAGRVNLPLQHCLAAERGGLADRRALLLVLSGCLKIDCKQSRTAVYSALPEVIQSSEEYFEFIFYHRKVFSKRPHGMGAGMRRFISKWYLSQDPYDLALEVTRVRSRHKWSHADLIKLARVRTKDPAVSAVLMAVVRGLGAAQQEFRDKPEAQPILEYMTCVKEINSCNEPDAAIRLIDKHSFDIDCLPTHLLNHAKVWEHALSRLPVRGVLSHLRTMSKRGFLSSDTSPVLMKVLQSIRDPLALAASKLQPADILTVIAQTEACWEHPPTPAHRTKTQSPAYVKIPSPHHSLVTGLHKMLVSSLSHVPKVPCSVLVCVDCRPTIVKGCWGLWSLKAVKAMSLNILALMKGGADVTLTTIGEDKLMQQLQLNTTDTVDSLANRLEKVKGGTIDPALLMSWAREGSKKADLVICMTDSHSEVEREELWTELELYRNTVCHVKFIYCALSSRSLFPSVANKSDPFMIDICGFGPDSTRIIQAFAKECF